MLLPLSLEDHLQMCLQHCRQYCSWFFFFCPSREPLLEGCDLLVEFHCCPPAAHTEFSVMKSHLHYSSSNWHTGFEACILMQWVLQFNNCMKKYLPLCVLNLIVPLMLDHSCNLEHYWQRCPGQQCKNNYQKVTVLLGIETGDWDLHCCNHCGKLSG